jgi:hypothetical protein
VDDIKARELEVIVASLLIALANNNIVLHGLSRYLIATLGEQQGSGEYSFLDAVDLVSQFGLLSSVITIRYV